ncbi:hypothetical protein DFQ04_2802 [Algoriphagus boseongensis]|uniref:Uncharacterized protein n=1 Tax=Algoriphagus boseongensis TaxID=1442587 RepID=A0A4R6T307_9BACT|nr:hypothetical protein DFQ04_2802 [Algoriphagus boseongensis]
MKCYKVKTSTVKIETHKSPIGKEGQISEFKPDNCKKNFQQKFVLTKKQVRIIWAPYWLLWHPNLCVNM